MIIKKMTLLSQTSTLIKRIRITHWLSHMVSSITSLGYWSSTSTA